MAVLSEYLQVLGWGLAGAITMAVSLVLLLKIFTWLTPVDEWAELRKGNVGIAIVMGAVIVAFGLVISAAIFSPSLGR